MVDAPTIGKNRREVTVEFNSLCQAAVNSAITTSQPPQNRPSERPGSLNRLGEQQLARVKSKDIHSRPHKSIFKRIEGKVAARKEALGWIPARGDLDFTGLDHVSQEAFDRLVKVDANLWQQELDSHEELFQSLSDRLPEAFWTQQKTLKIEIV